MLIVTLFGLGIYWVSTPDLVANQFAAAVAAGDSEKAESLFVGERELGVFPGDFASRSQLRGTTIQFDSPTFWDLVSGRRRIRVNVPYGDGWPEMDWQITIEVTRHGLEIVLYQS